MNKAELVEIIAAQHELPKYVVNNVITSLLLTVQDSLTRGERVTFVGFGTFESYVSKARYGHAPATGARIRVPEARRPKFTAGAKLRAAVRGETPPPSTGENDQAQDV